MHVKHFVNELIFEDFGLPNDFFPNCCRVTFPEQLDLNSFVEQGGGEEASTSEGQPDELTVSRCDDSSTTDSGSALEDEGCQPSQDMTPHTADINQVCSYVGVIIK